MEELLYWAGVFLVGGIILLSFFTMYLILRGYEEEVTNKHKPRRKTMGRRGRVLLVCEKLGSPVMAMWDRECIDINEAVGFLMDQIEVAPEFYSEEDRRQVANLHVTKQATCDSLGMRFYIKEM
jgi:hypothetical protein